MNHEIYEAHEKAKTLADVLAEMRIFRCRDLSTGKLEVCNAIANYFADRIEAAWKRERAEIEADALSVGGVVEAAARRERATTEKSSAVGNAAELREVVTALAAVILPPRDKAGEGGWLAWVRAMQGKARAALAKPPRNCDMYQDGQSAYNGWRDSFRDKRSPELLFSDWIFETAKEKNDGSK